ncbi:hypothetical protein [Microvirga puerhi]|uniref:Arginase n=1 Tax=Microvirga puerhi TaxID=2876078 RepID=A0ABS7VV73_9HYPH|nr:hypothetical protein [Microvirga puerhi]MBZ6078862.1 hypothetical protein [Microvirga puerhi]
MTIALTVLDTDATLTSQPAIRDRLAAAQARRIDLLDLGPSLRLWAWESDFDAFRARLPQFRSGMTNVFMAGSGDFHHLTAALVERADRPLTVIHFDNHPDGAWSFPRRHCGSWVNAALALAHVRKMITIGCCSDDLARLGGRTPWMQALQSGRLEVHPWSRPPATLRRGVHRIPGHRTEGRTLHWNSLAGTTWDGFVDDLVRQVAGETLWISIDKDVLGPAEAATNWDQGSMPLAYLEEALAALASDAPIAGVDICGEYTPRRHRHPAKRLEAWIDQPNDAPAGTAINEATNARLLNLLEAIL